MRGLLIQGSARFSPLISGDKGSWRCLTPPTAEGARIMLRMLYVSGASRQLSDDAIQEILAVSRRNNLRDGVTGMLLWADGVFIQILEGEAKTVRGVFGRIQADDRHRNVMVVGDEARVAMTIRVGATSDMVVMSTSTPFS